MKRRLLASLMWLTLAAALLPIVALGIHCGGAPLTSPSGASLSISAHPLFIPVVDGVSTVTVRGLKSASDGGGPVPDGTQIFLTSPVGIIDERAETRGGEARAFLRSNGRAGRAAVVASSGAGVSVTLDPPVVIGNAEGINIMLIAQPAIASPPGFTSEIQAIAFGGDNVPLPGVPLIFSATAGALASAGTMLRTDRAARSPAPSA
jgi:hypothetical protein